MSKNESRNHSRFISYFRNFSLHQTDLALVFIVFAIVIFGLIMVYSSSYIYAQERTGDGLSFIKKQLLIAMIGIFALLAASRLDFRKWYNWRFPILVLSAVLLSLVLVPGFGSRLGGAQRWLRIGHFSFQPGEFSKFSIIAFLAGQLAYLRKTSEIQNKNILLPLILPLPILLLLLIQPDFGTSALIVTVSVLLIYLSGVERRRLLGIILVAGIGGLWLMLGTEYRRARLIAFLDPWGDPNGKGFQILQSFIGLHHGGIWGIGLGNGKEKLFYLPEAHNDFIFAVIGEELGFVGISLLIVAYLLFIYRGFRIGIQCMKNHQEYFGMFLAIGITLIIGLQGFINMAVVLGLIPTKGIPLPFVSYGGSALLIDLFLVGVLLSISRGLPPRTQLNYQ